MQDLARGWTIVMAHMHGHRLAFWIALMVAVWLLIWAVRRQRNQAEVGDESLRPKPRVPLPGSDRGFRQ